MGLVALANLPPVFGYAPTHTLPFGAFPSLASLGPPPPPPSRFGSPPSLPSLGPPSPPPSSFGAPPPPPPFISPLHLEELALSPPTPLPPGLAAHTRQKERSGEEVQRWGRGKREAEVEWQGQPPAKRFKLRERWG